MTEQEAKFVILTMFLCISAFIAGTQLQESKDKELYSQSNLAGVQEGLQEGFDKGFSSGTRFGIGQATAIYNGTVNSSEVDWYTVFFKDYIPIFILTKNNNIPCN